MIRTVTGAYGPRTRRAVLRGAAAVGGASMIAGCGGPRARVDDAWTGLVADIVRELRADQPESVAAVEPRASGLAWQDKLSDGSANGEDLRRTASIRRFVEINGFDPRDVPPSRALEHAALVERLGACADLAALPFGRLEPNGGYRPYAVDPLRCSFVAFPILVEDTPAFAGIADAQAYVARLKLMPAAMVADVERLQADAAAGFVPPQIVLDRAAAVIEALFGLGLEGAPLRTAFVQRAQALGGALESQTPLAGQMRTLLGQVDSVLRSAILPAYQRAVLVLRGLRARASTTAGYTHSPDALVAYRRALDAALGKGFDPAAFRAAAEARLESHLGVLDSALRALGLAEGTVGQRLGQVRAAPRTTPFVDTDALRRAILDEVAGVAARMSKRFGEGFGAAAPPALQVVRAGAWRDLIGLGPVYRPADSRAPGVLVLPIADVTRWSPLDTVLVGLREGAPGRHLAQTLMGASDDPASVALRLTPSLVSVEGWSAYALPLALDMGLAASDPIAEIAILRGQALVAAAALLEFDLNSAEGGWETGLARYTSATGQSRSEAERLAERILAEPGFGIAADYGAARLIALREKARSTLGERFDLKSFHTVVLGALPGPLSAVEASVNRWVGRR